MARAPKTGINFVSVKVFQVSEETFMVALVDSDGGECIVDDPKPYAEALVSAHEDDLPVTVERWPA